MELDPLQPSVDALAKGVRWDLDSIFPTLDAAKENVVESLAQAKAIRQKYLGRVGSLNAIGMRDLLTELADFEIKLSKTYTYASFRSSLDSVSKENKDLSAFLQDIGQEISNETRFIDHEWKKVPQAVAQGLIDDPILAPYSKHLADIRVYIPHTWSEEAERFWAERGPAVSAWEEQFERILSKISVKFDAGDGPKKYNEPGIIAIYQGSPDRQIRERAFHAFYRTLARNKDYLALCYDTIVADKLKSDTLRNYPSAMSSRNLHNGVEDQAINNLLDSVDAALPIARQWWAAKAAAMGQSRLSIFDQSIELGNARKITYGEAQQLIDRALTEFSPALAGYVRDIYHDKRIDAESRLGKRGGAYCHPGLLDGKPYVLANFQGRMDDVFTLQHEFGHGIHDVLAYQAQNIFSAHPPLVLAEIASTFNELVLQDYLMRTETDPATRLALTSGDVSSTIATVFRQATMCRYEQKAFELRSQKQELTADRLSKIWWDTQTKMFDGAVELPPIYRLGWAYIPHFIGTPFYVYSYAFAQLCSLALYDKWKQEGPAFVPKYLGFLAAGGSRPTDQLLATVGIDIHDPSCWNGAFREFDRRVQEAITLIPGSNARAA